MSQFQNELLMAVQAAVGAGKAILEIYDKPSKVQYKDDQSPLTEADQAAHRIIVNTLRNETPDIPILSEEGRIIPYEERRQWNRFWLVDPLDGTKEFIKRNGEFTVNIALIDEVKPSMGIIYVPCRDQLYVGCKNVGSFKFENVKSLSLNSSVQKFVKAGLKLPLHKKSAPNTIRIVGSRSHGSEEFQQYVGSLKAENISVEITPAGSSLKFCLVAEGKADIYPRLGPTMEWDTAAGQAICEQAGFAVIQWNSRNPLCYNKPDLLNPFFSCIPRFEAIENETIPIGRKN